MITKEIGIGFVARINLQWKHGGKFLLTLLAYNTIVYLALTYFPLPNLRTPGFGLGAFGTVLAIMVGFRNNFSYDRWWEGRKLWGLLINYSRAWVGQVKSFIADNDPEDIKRLAYRHLAFVNALRIHLRKDRDVDSIVKYLSSAETKRIDEATNKPNMLLQMQRMDLKSLREKNQIDDFRHMQLDDTLTEFNNIQGASERINNTPLPRQYDYFTKLFIYIFTIILPIGLFNELGIYIIPLATIISYFFIVIDIIGEVNEDPFVNFLTALPLGALSRTIEINVMEQLGEAKPEPIKPIDGILM